MKKKITLDQAAFAKIISTLKTFEKKKKPITIGRKSLPKFLATTVETGDDASDPKYVRTKRRILYIAGDYSSSPYTLAGTLDLKANLGYGTDEYSLLQLRLDELVKEYLATANVSKKEANDCKKVSDCVTLVNSKTSTTSA